MEKRNLFEELMAGLAEMADLQRQKEEHFRPRRPFEPRVYKPYPGDDAPEA
ncbi:hypothetical protein [Erwinia sp. JUb26]|uniref:hypothetical protein n=1 Tax=Erwinia sp. JUb26 TaxID=2485126 RepID=UPI0013158DC6|nr:hypothetical protein [Erwinia sp. JUb26]